MSLALFSSRQQWVKNVITYSITHNALGENIDFSKRRLWCNNVQAHDVHVVHPIVFVVVVLSKMKNTVLTITITLWWKKQYFSIFDSIITSCWSFELKTYSVWITSHVNSQWVIATKFYKISNYKRKKRGWQKSHGWRLSDFCTHRGPSGKFIKQNVTPKRFVFIPHLSCV